MRAKKRWLSWPIAGYMPFQIVTVRGSLQKEAPADQRQARRIARGLPALASSPLPGSLALLQ
jgi:hypothetical protein